jgi:Carboxypeptidase regulatory-like domain
MFISKIKQSMNMSVKLDDIDLSKAVKEEADSSSLEIRTIYGIGITDIRNLVEIEIPGSAGNMLQDMGCEPVKISFFGEIMGLNSIQTLEKLFSKYDAGTPFEFHSDITALAEVNKVILEEFQIEEAAGSISNYKYRMLLREYKEPPPPREEAPPDQDQQASEEAEKESEIDDIRGQLLDAEGNPAKGVKVKIKGPGVEYEPITTNENGYYELLDVPEGKYEITCDEEGFEDLKVDVDIKKS